MIFLAAEITQVIDSIPWVCCASGNVFFVKAFEVIGHLGSEYRVPSFLIIIIIIILSADSDWSLMSSLFLVKTIPMTKNQQVAGSSSAGHAIIYRESALTFEEWNTAELHEQV